MPCPGNTNSKGKKKTNDCWEKSSKCVCACVLINFLYFPIVLSMYIVDVFRIENNKVNVMEYMLTTVNFELWIMGDL